MKKILLIAGLIAAAFAGYFFFIRRPSGNKGAVGRTTGTAGAIDGMFSDFTDRLPGNLQPYARNAASGLGTILTRGNNSAASIITSVAPPLINGLFSLFKSGSQSSSNQRDRTSVSAPVDEMAGWYDEDGGLGWLDTRADDSWNGFSNGSFGQGAEYESAAYGDGGGYGYDGGNFGQGVDYENAAYGPSLDSSSSSNRDPFTYGGWN